MAAKKTEPRQQIRRRLDDSFLLGLNIAKVTPKVKRISTERYGRPSAFAAFAVAQPGKPHDHARAEPGRDVSGLVAHGMPKLPFPEKGEPAPSHTLSAPIAISTALPDLLHLPASLASRPDGRGDP
jgi:hypothetical protein